MWTLFMENASSTTCHKKLSLSHGGSKRSSSTRRSKLRCYQKPALGRFFHALRCCSFSPKSSRFSETPARSRSHNFVFAICSLQNPRCAAVLAFRLWLRGQIILRECPLLCCFELFALCVSALMRSHTYASTHFPLELDFDINARR